MTRESLLHLLSAACGAGRTAGQDRFEFSETDRASLIVATGGPPLLVESLSRLEVHEDFVAVMAGRNEVFFLALDRILGLKVQRQKREGAGFLP